MIRYFQLALLTNHIMSQNVTTKKNQPSPYRFTQANQRNSWTILDLPSQIPLKGAFSSNNNQDAISSQLFVRY